MREEIKQRVEMIRRGEVPEGYKQTKIVIIPVEWEVKQLGSYFDFKNGLNKEKEYFGRGNPIVNYTDVYHNSGLYKHMIKGMVDLTNKEIENYNVKYGDVFFTRTSETIDEIGYASTILFHPEKTVFSGFLIRARPKNRKLNPHFCRYIFSSYQIRKQICQKSSYTTRALTSGKNLKDVRMVQPLFAEQQAISQILSTADKAIETTQSLITLKEQKKKWLMQNLLTGKVRLPEYDTFPVPVQERIRMINSGIVPEGYKQTKVGIIPKNWKLELFKNIADKRVKWSISGGPFGSNLKVSDYTDSGVRIIQLQNIGDGKFLDNYKIYTTSKKADELISCNIYPGEIILSKMGDPVARACLMPDSNKRFLMASDGIRFVVDETKNSKIYIFYSINYSLFRKQAERVSTGTTRKRINLPDLKNIKIPVPSLQEQTPIANILTTADKEIDLLNQKLDTLKQQKKALMQLLLTGIMRTTGLNLSSEPAEEGAEYVQ